MRLVGSIRDLLILIYLFDLYIWSVVLICSFARLLAINAVIVCYLFRIPLGSVSQCALRSGYFRIQMA